ncbi:MAG: substrate-binding domain-containing protein [Lentisphaerae bacterium]|nr:substrate-binding domain-containing protein [Lentisphaerota bacterium]
MKALFTVINPQRKASVRGQITAALREMVLDGRLKPGDRLPSSQALAKLWNAPQPTIQRALSPLVKEGLLDRTPRVGTFVRRREKRLVRVGIYASGHLWRSPAYAFGRALCSELHHQLMADDIDESVWVDPRPAAEQGQPWPELVQASHGRRFQVLIVPAAAGGRYAWLDNLPVPVVYLSAINFPNRVTLDVRQWAKVAMQLLADQGSSRVGVICSIRLPKADDRDGSPEHHQFRAALEKHARRLGLDFRPKWLMCPENDFVNHAVEMPEFGHDSLLALWRQAERPDGLAVIEDTTASGVLMAIMREQIRVPQDLKLVLHRNAEIGLFCPVPAAFVDVHVEEVAAALITQAERLYHGKAVSAIVVPHHPIPARSDARAGARIEQ